MQERRHKDKDIYEKQAQLKVRTHNANLRL